MLRSWCMRASSGRYGLGWLAPAMVLAISGAPAATWAQGIRAGALAPQIKSAGVTPELRDKFHESVVKGLASLAGPSGPGGELGEVVPAPETRRALGEELLSCGGQASCLPKALAALRVNRLVATELTVVGKSYTISLRLYDGQGHELTHADDICEICTVREADEAVAKAAARLAAVARTFPVERVGSGAKPKPTPPPREEPRPEPTSNVSPMQEPPRPPPAAIITPAPRRKVPWRPLGFASMALGVVGLAVGIPLVVIDGKPTCDLPNPEVACPEVYNTAGGGATMIAIGSIAFIASIPLFYFDYRDRHPKVSALRLRGAPTAGGAGFALEGRF
jgi:hypothetical protein